ncbi:hypothetical protein BCR44DRAFT_73032 [Catenaria anguillulae PL171]|uniref:FHA domain-containing protein n=1 Tax=Catenaria anguillulae PL171 TaxID=765915 RepID=A0A1Y2I4U5_9FUNG|nr:hypothetical protein BCR44DRAFT_73032 [Catenaria anguillulae PL171]
MDKLTVPSTHAHLPGSSPTMSVATTLGPTAASMHSPGLSHGLLLRSSSSTGSLTPGTSGQPVPTSSSALLLPIPPAPRLSVIPPTAVSGSSGGGNLFFSQHAAVVLIPQSLQPSDVLRLPLCTDGDCLAIGRLVESKRSTMIVTDSAANYALAASAPSSSPPPPIPPLPAHQSSASLQPNPTLSSSANNMSSNSSPQPTRKPKVVTDYNKAIVMLRSKVISRHHCRIFRQNKRYWIQDTKSSSGTFVNGRRLSAINVESAPFEIFDGDLLQLGEDYDHQGVIHECLRYKVVINPVDATPTSSDPNVNSNPAVDQNGASSPEFRPNPSDAATVAAEAEFATIWAALAPTCPSTFLQPLLSGIDPKAVLDSAAAPAPDTPVELISLPGNSKALIDSVSNMTWQSDTVRTRILALADRNDPRLDLLHSSLVPWNVDAFREAAAKLVQDG